MKYAQGLEEEIINIVHKLLGRLKEEKRGTVFRFSTDNIFRRFSKCEKSTRRLLVSACTSVHMKQCRSSWKVFRESFYFVCVLLKIVEKSHVGLKSKKNNRHFV